MSELTEVVKNAVEEYQCPGCINGSNTSCYEKDEYGVGCGKHDSGTMMSYVGSIFLGMPKGFNRVGPHDGEQRMKITIFNSFEELGKLWGEYDKFNVPCWKYVDAHEATLVRGLSPRTNRPFLHIILEDCADKIDCIEITAKDIEEMD